jgi:hypothetical protein
MSLVAAALATVGMTGTAFANHSWNGYHWARTSNPLALNLGSNVTPDWTPYLTTASADWSVSNVLHTTIVAGSANRRCDATAGMDQVCNARYGKTGWLGLAQIWVDANGHITQGTTKMNDTYFALAQYNNANERQHVMCQEIGHTFGLAHQDTTGASLGTCMDYSMDPSSTHPNQHDYDELDLIYAHLDATSTASPASAPSNGKSGMDVSDRSQWGQLQEKHGSNETYSRQFSDGQTLVTFVTDAS